MTTKELKALKRKIEFHKGKAEYYKVKHEGHANLASQYELQIRSFLNSK